MTVEDERSTEVKCKLAEGFSLWEKVYAQSSFLLMALIGTVGIAVADWRWAPAYVLIHVYGFAGIIMRHVICPRCPHIHEYGDCLQAPPKLTLWLIKKRKTGPLSATEKFLHYAIFILIPVFPIYWLLQNTALLVLFLVFAAMWYLAQFLYFCKRCRVKECPFNRAV